MSLELLVAVDNAEDQLGIVLPAYAAGKLRQPQLPHALAILYRQRGTSQLLLQGIPEPFFLALMQSASLYAYALGGMAEQDKVTSLAACWWDAVAGESWEAAREIAMLSRPTHNPAQEHEDDFLYVLFMMQYALHAGSSDAAQSTAAFEQAQQARLTRWEEVLEGAPDPRLDLCRALVASDKTAFQQALNDVADQRAKTMDEKLAKGAVKSEQVLWSKPIWPQGLGLLRLAQRNGFGSDLTCRFVPEVIRIDSPFRYSPDAWRSMNFAPVRV
jgi:hypothetical protein